MWKLNNKISQNILNDLKNEKGRMLVAFEAVFRSWLNFGNQLNQAIVAKKISRCSSSTVELNKNQLQLRSSGFSSG